MHSENSAPLQFVFRMKEETRCSSLHPYAALNCVGKKLSAIGVWHFHPFPTFFRGWKADEGYQTLL